MYPPERALSLLGVQNANFINTLSDHKATRVTSQTTLGIVIDDPTKAEEISRKILHHFDKGKSSTCAATYTPRCTFMTTLNQQCLDEVVAMPPRYAYHSHFTRCHNEL